MVLSLTASIALFLAGICLFIFCGNRALHDVEENKCDMTYMFEYPRYIRVNLKKKLSEQFPRYNLYLYGEGEYAEQLRSFKLRGIPVLFIPGNAGSYKQVRSFASVALRKAESRGKHFNYFTVDFYEELSGLFGSVLLDQAKFVHSCLRHILRMYKGNIHTPDSVVLIGHSMGGLVTGALFSLDEFQPSMIHTMITLGTPHIAPVLALDTALTSFYNKVTNVWQRSVVTNVTIVSISGGSRDLLVPVKFSSLSSTAVAFHHTVVSTAIPYVWLSIDHLALCWCKQLVLVVNRALFDMIDPQTGQIQQSSYLRSQVLMQYFGYSEARGGPDDNIVMDRMETLSPGIMQYNQASSGVGQYNIIKVSQTILIPTKPTREQDSYFVALTTKLKSIKISLCTKIENNTCIGMRDVPLQTLPTSRGTSELVYIPPARLSKASHIIISTSKPKAMPGLFVQFTNNVNKLFTNISFMSSVQTFPNTNGLLTIISLPMVQNNYGVFVIRVVRSNCKDEQSVIFGGKVHVPWFYEDVYADVITEHELEMSLKVHTARLLVTECPSLYIWNVGQCSLEVHVQYEFGKSMGQLFKVNVAEIPKWLYFWIAVVITIQLGEVCNVYVNSKWSDSWSSVSPKKVWKCIPLSIVCEAIGRILTYFEDLTVEDLVLQLILPRHWLFPHFFILFSAFAVIVFLLCFLQLMRSILVWFLSCCFPQVSQYQCDKRRFSASVLRWCLFACSILSLSFFSASLALYFLTFILFINNCNKVRELKELVLEKHTNTSYDRLCNHLRFSETMLLFLLIVCFQSTPAFISWFKVTHISWSLTSDPFRPLLLVLAPTVVTICLVDLELKKTPKYLPSVALLIWSVAFVFLSMDKLPFLLGTVVLTVCVFSSCKTTQHVKVS